MAKKLQTNIFRIAGAGLLAAFLLLSGCSGGKAPESLTLTDLRQPALALIYVAEAKGYFKDENLSLNYLRYSSGRDAMESLYADTSEVAIAFEFPVAAGALAGKTFQVISALHRSNENSGLVARRDHGIEIPVDLKGKRIGLAPNTNTDFMLSILLKEAGLNDDSVIRVPFKPEQLVTALAAGEVDAAVTWQPHVANAVATIPANQAVLMRTPSFTELSMLSVRPETLTRKPEALSRLIRALLRAEEFIAKNDALAMELVVKHLDEQPPETIRQAWPAFRHQVRLDNLLLSALANEAAWMARQRTPVPLVPDFRKYVYTDLLETARPQAVTLKPLNGE